MHKREIDARYKELTGALMEAGKAQDLQAELGTQESQWCGSGLKARRTDTQGKLMFQLESEDRKRADVLVL